MIGSIRNVAVTDGTLLRSKDRSEFYEENKH